MSSTGINKILLLIFLFVLTKEYLLRYITFFAIKPDLFIIVLVYLSLQYGLLFGTIFGFLIGVSADSLTPTVLGLGALCKSWVGFSIGMQKDKFFKDSGINQSLLVFIAYLLHDIIYLFIYTKMNSYEFFALFIRKTLPTSLYTSLTAPIFIYVAKKIYTAEIKWNT